MSLFCWTFVICHIPKQFKGSIQGWVWGWLEINPPIPCPHKWQGTKIIFLWGLNNLFKKCHHCIINMLNINITQEKRKEKKVLLFSSYPKDILLRLVGSTKFYPGIVYIKYYVIWLMGVIIGISWSIIWIDLVDECEKAASDVKVS